MSQQYQFYLSSNSKVSYLFPKKFLSKVDLDRIFFKSTGFLTREENYPSSLIYTHDLEIKLALYAILKQIKSCKVNSFCSAQDSFKVLDELGLKLQSSLLYTSLSELEKKKRLNRLKDKLIKYQRLLLRKKIIPQTNAYFFEKTELIPSFQSAFLKYSRMVSNSQERANQSLLSFLKTRQFFNKILRARLFSFLISGKIKYKKIFSHVEKNRGKIRNFFLFNDLSHQNFRISKERVSKQFKKLVWKRKKGLKWKKVKLQRFFGFRRRVSFNFYIPKHFEINYKTFNSFYLGYTDLPSVNSRIPFWLNLRKLVTFLSS